MEVLLIILGGLLTINEFAVLLTYGSFINKTHIDYFSDLKPDDYWLNSLDTSIIGLENKRGFITNLPFSIFSKYYIDGYGTVPRWSKLHKKINEYYLKAEIK